MCFDCCHFDSIFTLYANNFKQAWSLYTVKRNYNSPNLLDFNNWLKEKAEAHERNKSFPGKTPLEEPILTKTTIGFFAFAYSVKSNKRNNHPVRSALLNIHYGDARSSRKTTLLKGAKKFVC